MYVLIERSKEGTIHSIFEYRPQFDGGRSMDDNLVTFSYLSSSCLSVAHTACTRSHQFPLSWAHLADIPHVSPAAFNSSWFISMLFLMFWGLSQHCCHWQVILKTYPIHFHLLLFMMSCVVARCSPVLEMVSVRCWRWSQTNTLAVSEAGVVETGHPVQC